MLQMKLTLKGIDYEAVVKMAYPTLLKRISGTLSRNLPVRLIRELGEDGEKVLVALMA